MVYILILDYDLAPLSEVVDPLLSFELTHLNFAQKCHPFLRLEVFEHVQFLLVGLRLKRLVELHNVLLVVDV